MTTARQIITRAMQKIGVLVKSEPPSADEADDALASLNALISSWSNDSLNIYARTLESFPLTGASSYTIGTGGDFNTVRPTAIINAYVRQGTTDLQVSVVDDTMFAGIMTKSVSGLPYVLNYSNSYPLGVIKMYPVGLSDYTLFLLSEKAVSGFATLDTQLNLPDGWERALIYNLAIELAPEYAQQPDASVVKIAAESLGAIRTKVAQVRGMDAYPRSVGVENVYTGWYN